MKSILFGAASLLALSAAACADRAAEADYAEAETSTSEATTAATDPIVTEEPWPEDAVDAASADDYASAPDAIGKATTPTGDLAQTDPMSSPSQASAPAGAWIDVSAVTTRSDAETVADSTFTMADANADGVIDRTEFLTIAAPPMAAAVEPVEGAPDVSATAETAPADTPAAPVNGADEIFADAAAGKNEATVESLREAFLERFDEADANKDETLDQAERQAFQRLALGQ